MDLYAKELVKAEKEIEALREALCKKEQEIETLRSDYENVCQDIELQNKQMGEWYADKRQAEDERDKWKRRVKLAINWMTYAEGYGTAVGLGEVNDADLLSGFTSTYPEAANWFEEE